MYGSVFDSFNHSRFGFCFVFVVLYEIESHTTVQACFQLRLIFQSQPPSADIRGKIHHRTGFLILILKEIFYFEFIRWTVKVKYCFNNISEHIFILKDVLSRDTERRKGGKMSRKRKESSTRWYSWLMGACTQEFVNPFRLLLNCKLGFLKFGKEPWFGDFNRSPIDTVE